MSNRGGPGRTFLDIIVGRQKHLKGEGVKVCYYLYLDIYITEYNNCTTPPPHPPLLFRVLYAHEDEPASILALSTLKSNSIFQKILKVFEPWKILIFTKFEMFIGVAVLAD